MNKISDVGVVKKGWGEEEIWASNENYCGKFLKFSKGKKFSMHFHKDKLESWYVLSGSFLLETINTLDASIRTFSLSKGATWTNYPLEPHKLTCIEDGVILEVSTADYTNDNYRVFPGDSQKE